MTRRIHVLPDHVANKIAAGEVVERPASVLKELMENALDASATQLDVEVVAGGKTLVSVADNGGGMNRDDALLAVERYATSKIDDVDDIERIETFGFRGEALAAISSVSRFTLKTRRPDDVEGSELLMSAGKIQDLRPAGCPPGTCIEVRNLFHNVPARRKFLRSDPTELAHVRQVFMLYALSQSRVGLSLTVDGRLAHQLPAQEDLEYRLRDLFSVAFVANLRRVDYSAGGVAVSGWIGLPAASRADRSEQYLFINGRPAGAPVLTAAIRVGYHSLMPRERHPVLFLFVTLDASLVDVNVHPTKKEVRFRDAHTVRDAVSEAIRRALGHRPAVHPAPSDNVGGIRAAVMSRPADPVPAPVARELFPFPHKKTPPQPAVAAHSIPSGPGSEFRPVPGSVSAGVTAGNTVPSAGDQVSAEGSRKSGDARVASPPAPAPWRLCRILGQISGLYVVMETDEGLTLMDPHAAHERVLYERYMKALAQGRVESQNLLMAETVSLSPRTAHQVRRHLEVLKRMGFGVADFGGDTFVVDALPACFQELSPQVLLADLATAIEETGERRGADRVLEERIAQAACKASVKARQTLTLREIEGLVEELERTEMPYTCPHGRPTLIHMSKRELDKKFGRF